MELNTDSTSNWLDTQEPTLSEAPCQNCGRMVTIMLPFIGCVFCRDCVGADTGNNDGTEDFYEPRRLSYANP